MGRRVMGVIMRGMVRMKRDQGKVRVRSLVIVEMKVMMMC